MDDALGSVTKYSFVIAPFCDEIKKYLSTSTKWLVVVESLQKQLEVPMRHGLGSNKSHDDSGMAPRSNWKIADFVTAVSNVRCKPRD